MNTTFLRRADYDKIARKAIGIFTDVERAIDGCLQTRWQASPSLRELVRKCRDARGSACGEQ